MDDIIFFWKNRVVNVDILHECNQHVVVIIISRINETPWIFFSIYASTKYRQQRVLREEIPRLVDQDISSLVNEDFNYIDGPQEKRRGAIEVEDLVNHGAR